MLLPGYVSVIAFIVQCLYSPDTKRKKNSKEAEFLFRVVSMALHHRIPKLQLKISLCCKTSPNGTVVDIQNVGCIAVCLKPISVTWDFSALTSSYPVLGVLWTQWEGLDHTAELGQFNRCMLESVPLTT